MSEITISVYRRQSTEKQNTLITEYTASLDGAIVSFVKYELGYGGRLADFSDTMITIETPIMNKIDTTVYSGEASDIDKLLQVADLWLDLEKTISFDDYWERTEKITKGVALLVRGLFGKIWGDMVFEHADKLEKCLTTRE